MHCILDASQAAADVTSCREELVMALSLTSLPIHPCRTPLIASLVANVANFTMVATFIFKFQWGVAGAALATTGSQYICAGMMFYLLVRNKILQPRHLAIRPVWEEWVPMLRVRSIAVMCQILILLSMLKAVCVLVPDALSSLLAWQSSTAKQGSCQAHAESASLDKRLAGPACAFFRILFRPSLSAP